MDYELSTKKSLQDIAAAHVTERSNGEFSVELTGEVIALDGILFHIGDETDNLNRPGSYSHSKALFQFDVDSSGEPFVIYSGDAENVLELAEEKYFSDHDGWAAEYRRSAGMPPLT